jgi:hypothetical protein
MLQRSALSYVPEIGSCAGRYGLQVVSLVGCRVLGIDVNQPGIHVANQPASAQSWSGQVHFAHCFRRQAAWFRRPLGLFKRRPL